MKQLISRYESHVLSMLQSILRWGRTSTLVAILSFDLVMCVVSVWIAYSLRYGEWNLASRAIGYSIAVSLVLWIVIFTARRTYQSILRFVGIRTLVDLAISCAILGLISSVIYTVWPVPGVPRTVGVIHALVFASLLIVGRLAAAYLVLDLVNQRLQVKTAQRVVIYGAGSAGRQLSMSLRYEPEMVLQAFIDDNPRLQGKRLEGVPVYRGDDLAGVIAETRPDIVVLALPGIGRAQREAIVRKFENISVRVLTLPAIGDLVGGKVTFADLREIELGDLLGRAAVPPDEALLAKTIAGRTVMITGAGGSIGSELCRQIAKLAPRRIVMAEMTEYALYKIDDELREEQKNGKISNEIEIVVELGSVADEYTVQRLFERWRPETVFHAAAYKHVPLVESNVVAGVRNNVFSTVHCARAAIHVGTADFVLVSTDKAVRPTNVMGATKRVCELVLQALASEHPTTHFSMVRFGNVLGSSGSVVPRFERQIKAGGPVTLTHSDVTRYFMIIPEAAQLVIQAGAMAEGGEVYVLDMGEPVRIKDLARTMINLSGLTVRDSDNPHGDIEIREVGLRRGEKLYEELLIGNSPMPTAHSRIMKARESFLTWGELKLILERLRGAVQSGHREEVLALISALVPEFSGEQGPR